MPAGRPPKPVEQKRRLGNPGKRRLPVPLVVLAPSSLPATDDRIIETLVETGVASWIGQTDMPTVRLAQRLWDDSERLRAVLDDEFSEPAFRAYRDTIKELRACLSLLGLSPSDRSRLGVAEVRTRSKLEELMDRRAARRTRAG